MFVPVFVSMSRCVGIGREGWREIGSRMPSSIVSSKSQWLFFSATHVQGKCANIVRLTLNIIRGTSHIPELTYYVVCCVHVLDMFCTRGMGKYGSLVLGVER